MYRFIHNGIIYNILINTFFNDNEKCMEMTNITFYGSRTVAPPDNSPWTIAPPRTIAPRSIAPHPPIFLFHFYEK